MLPVKLPHRFDRRALLVSQALAHLRTERGPIVSAHVRFKTRGEQRAHRHKHRLAAVHAHRALRRGSRSRLRLRRLHRRSGLRLHLHGNWRLRLSGGRERHHRAQSNHDHLSLTFFHASCRSPHSVQLLFLSPPVAVPRTEGHIWKRSMSCHDATASCQFTSPHTPSQGIPLLHLRALRGLRVRHYRRPSFWNAPAAWTTLALCRGICLQWRCCLALRGMAAPMIRPLMKILSFIPGYVLIAIALPSPLHAQLVREKTAPPPQQVSAEQDAQNAASTQIPEGKKRLSQEVQLTGQQSWIDTGIDIQAGEHVLVTATGKLRYVDAKDDNGPDGLPRGFKDLLRVLPFNEAGRGTLIGLVGDKDVARPFVIGARRDVAAPISGRLSVGINQTTDDTGDGTYVVRIEVYVPEGAARVVAKQVSSLPGIDNNLFSKIPRRVADKEGNAGDMVNFLILGSEDAMQRVFTNSGWVKVDADVKATVLHGIIESLSKESYLTMPMSQLYLFGRPQDYGWAHAEPISVVRSRNHLRIWK